MKKLLLLIIIPFLTFGQNEELSDMPVKEQRTFSMQSLVNTGVSFFGSSFKTNMDFGLCFYLTGGGFLDTLKTVDPDLDLIGVAISMSMLFDSESPQRVRAQGDARFLSFKLVGKVKDRFSVVDFSFLIDDQIGLFYDDAFRLSITQQISEMLYVTGGWYLDRDKKSDPNSRHDLPLFGLGINF
tara:strand:+ start:404 stop:955 length:552 start_codon:yes stop_codon:yes gene_type:complete